MQGTFEAHGHRFYCGRIEAAQGVPGAGSLYPAEAGARMEAWRRGRIGINLATRGTPAFPREARRAGSRGLRRFQTAAWFALVLLAFWFGMIVSSHAMNGQASDAEAAVETVAEESVAVKFDVAAPAAREPVAAVHVVKPGDTLWAIAKLHMPDGADIREYVYLLRETNGLSSAHLTPGQLLSIPAFTE